MYSIKYLRYIVFISNLYHQQKNIFFFSSFSVYYLLTIDYIPILIP